LAAGRGQNILPGRGRPVALPPYAPACLPAPEHTSSRAAAYIRRLRREHAMELTTPASDLVTCARAECAARVPVAETTYVDGAGQLCASCTGPVPEWLYEIEPPY
jgi:hypothetical protein